jgi:glycosyltransferase involved in cell wall biosynthesis
MRIVIGVHHFPPNYVGGAEWRAYRTARALLQAGHDVLVAAVERIDDPAAQPLRHVDEVFKGVPVRRFSFNLAAAPDPLRWEYNNLWVGEHFHQRFVEQRPDIFHVMSGYLLTGSPIAAAQALKIPTVVTLTDFWFLCRRISMLRTDGSISTLPIDPLRCARCLGEEKRRYRLPAKVMPRVMDAFWRFQGDYLQYFQARRAALQQIMSGIDLAICPSNFIRDMYREAGMVARRMEFLRQGHAFQNLAPEHLSKTPSPVLRIGYLGQIAPLKGVHVLVDAVRQLPELPIELRIYGDGAAFPGYCDKLKARIGNDTRIHFEGVYERSQLTGILRETDVVVVPSLWYENSPNVILEAYVHATPVIASNFGGMAELVDDEHNGAHFAVGNAADLARQLQRLVDYPALLSKLTKGAANTSPPTVTEELAKMLMLYQSLL